MIIELFWYNVIMMKKMSPFNDLTGLRSRGSFLVQSFDSPVKAERMKRDYFSDRIGITRQFISAVQ